MRKEGERRGAARARRERGKMEATKGWRRERWRARRRVSRVRWVCQGGGVGEAMVVGGLRRGRWKGSRRVFFV